MATRYLSKKFIDTVKEHPKRWSIIHNRLHFESMASFERGELLKVGRSKVIKLEALAWDLGLSAHEIFAEDESLTL